MSQKGVQQFKQEKGAALKDALCSRSAMGKPKLFHSKAEILGSFHHVSNWPRNATPAILSHHCRHFGPNLEYKYTDIRSVSASSLCPVPSSTSSWPPLLLTLQEARFHERTVCPNQLGLSSALISSISCSMPANPTPVTCSLTDFSLGFNGLPSGIWVSHHPQKGWKTDEAW